MTNFRGNYALLGAGAAATATGTTLSSTPVFSFTGFGGAIALVSVAVTSTANGLACRVGTASGTLSDLAGSFTTAQTTMVMLEVNRPSGGEFFNFQLRQGTSGQHGPIYVFGTNPKALPTTNSSLLTYKLVNAPGTGTATSS